MPTRVANWSGFFLKLNSNTSSAALGFLAVSLDAPRALPDQRNHDPGVPVGNTQLALIQARQDRIDLSDGEARRVGRNRAWRSARNKGLRMLKRDPRLAWQLDVSIQ